MPDEGRRNMSSDPWSGSGYKRRENYADLTKVIQSKSSDENQIIFLAFLPCDGDTGTNEKFESNFSMEACIWYLGCC